jgi:hypothetical protein
VLYDEVINVENLLVKFDSFILSDVLLTLPMINRVEAKILTNKREKQENFNYLQKVLEINLRT